MRVKTFFNVLLIIVMVLCVAGGLIFTIQKHNNAVNNNVTVSQNDSQNEPDLNAIPQQQTGQSITNNNDQTVQTNTNQQAGSSNNPTTVTSGNQNHAMAQLQSKLILSQLQQQFPREANSFVITDPLNSTRFYIAINTDPAAIFAYDASLDSQWQKNQLIEVNTSDTLFFYKDKDNVAQNHLLLMPLAVKNGKLIFGEIPDDWSPMCESTLLTFGKNLYSIDLSITGSASPQKYTLASDDISAEKAATAQCQQETSNVSIP